MSREPEHLSLDEVKKLLKSLEDVSAPDEPEPARHPPPTVQAPIVAPPAPIATTEPAKETPITLTAAPRAIEAARPETTLPAPRSHSLGQKAFFPALGLIFAFAASILLWRPADLSTGGANPTGPVTAAATAPIAPTDTATTTAAVERAEPRAAGAAPISTAAITQPVVARSEPTPAPSEAPAPPAEITGAKVAQAAPPQRKAAPEPAPPAPQPAVQPPRASSPAATPPMSDSSRADDVDVARLVADGKAQIGAGLVASARLLFRRAADAGNPEAARLLGDTFDPAKLFTYGVRGIEGDIEKAIYWYERADELGDPHAKARLLSLGAR